MKVIKHNIECCFNNAGETYDQHSRVQKMCCSKLIEMLAMHDRNYQVIADMACGTGFCIGEINKNLNYKKLYAIDLAKDLLNVAKSRLNNKNIEYIHGDFDRELLSKDYVDLLFCNMGLQWSLSLQETLKLFHNYLTKDGVLGFSIPLAGTFVELRDVSRNHFCDLGEIENHLQESGFFLEKIDVKKYTENFTGPIEAARSIKSVGANFIKDKSINLSGLITKNKFKQIFNIVSDYKLTYNIGFFIAKKSETI